MIGDNIRRIRKSKGISQEELSVSLNVVRQTISKWEQGISVPDAEMLIKISKLFDVSVNTILGIEQDNDITSLTEDLAKANELLAQAINSERTRNMAGKKRGLILFLSFMTLIIALLFQNQTITIFLVYICILAVVIILYRNLELLSDITMVFSKIRVLKLTTAINFSILSAGVIGTALVGFKVVDMQNDGRLFAMLLVACVIVFSGIILPKLPFTRHTGLRLPWTVIDEGTWNVAHKVVGFTALPIAILYVASTLTVQNFEMVTLCAVIAWIGVPAVISYIYFYRKMHG